MNFVKPPTATIRIVIADDHALIREGLKALLQLQAGVVVVAAVDSLEELVSQLASSRCDVILLDRDLQCDGRADVRELSESAHVLIMCDGADDQGDAVNALRTGARGVLFKRGTVESLNQAIRTVAEGQVWMPPELQARVTETLRERRSTQLTPREAEIVHQVSMGLRNGEIAKNLFISEQTVKTHLSHIFRKISVRDRAALTLYAARIGLVSGGKRG